MDQYTERVIAELSVRAARAELELERTKAKLEDAQRALREVYELRSYKATREALDASIAESHRLGG